MIHRLQREYCQWAHGVDGLSRPLSMREVLGSSPNVSIGESYPFFLVRNPNGSTLSYCQDSVCDLATCTLVLFSQS